MHIYPIHDMVMALIGGCCGAAVTVAIADVRHTIDDGRTNEKTEG